MKKKYTKPQGMNRNNEKTNTENKTVIVIDGERQMKTKNDEESEKKETFSPFFRRQNIKNFKKLNFLLIRASS